MATGYHALTEKEKDTLRLLANGHDAKSIARHLGLSVHTIHERLRDARRKLAVSSSREAARLVRAVETQTPELLGDKPLGDAAAHHLPQPAGHAATPALSRRGGWMIGGLVMSFALAFYALASLSGGTEGPAPTVSSAPSSPTAVVATPAAEQAAVDAAKQFLALLDRDDWTASWHATHKSFQLLNTVDWWAQASRKVRGEVGTITSRELATVNFTPAPPNGYWEIAFKARSSKKGAVVETLSLASEGGGWKVTGISVE